MSIEIINVLLRGHDDRYALCEIISAFIPRVKLQVVADIPAQGDYVISELTEKNGICSYKTVIYYKGQLREHTTLGNRRHKSFVKLSFYDCALGMMESFLPWGALTGIRPAKIARAYLSQGLSPVQARQRFADDYRTSGEKADLAIRVAQTELEVLADKNPNAVSLYIGIPFCPTRCLYCSFTSQSIKFTSKFVEPYLEALKKEIAYTAKIARELGVSIETIYMGGGTPTSLTAPQMDNLLTCLEQHFDLTQAKEFTIEAGRPDTIDMEKLRVMRGHGVDRISINPQTMNQKTLNLIGRSHTPQDIIDSYELAVQAGFSSINMDLIAGLPDETVEHFSHTLEEVEKLDPTSVTVHTMCIKRSSFLAEQYDMYDLSGAEVVNAMLNLAAEDMAAHGRHPYYLYRQKNMLGNLENVGYCKKGHENRYNIYIMEEVQSILALGAGASTKLVEGDLIRRVYNVKEVSEYVGRIDEMLHRKDGIIKEMKA